MRQSPYIRPLPEGPQLKRCESCGLRFRATHAFVAPVSTPGVPLLTTLLDEDMERLPGDDCLDEEARAELHEQLDDLPISGARIVEGGVASVYCSLCAAPRAAQIARANLRAYAGQCALEDAQKPGSN